MISDRGDVAWILVSSLRYFLHRNAVEINFIMDAKKIGQKIFTLRITDLSICCCCCYWREKLDKESNGSLHSAYSYKC